MKKRRIVAVIGFAIFVTSLTIHFLSSEYESFNFVMAVGLVVTFIGLLWGYGRPESDHYYAKELPSSSYGAMAVSGAFAAFCTIVAIVGSLSSGNPWFLVALLGTLVFVIVIRMLRRERSRFDFEDMMTPDSSECPNCGHRVGRFERSCVGCGAVVWILFHPKPDAQYSVPPGNKVPRRFSRAKVGKTIKV